MNPDEIPQHPMCRCSAAALGESHQPSVADAAQAIVNAESMRINGMSGDAIVDIFPSFE